MSLATNFGRAFALTVASAGRAVAFRARGLVGIRFHFRGIRVSPMAGGFAEGIDA